MCRIFFYLPDFGRFSQSRDQSQPGSFLWSKREDPGNEVVDRCRNETMNQQHLPFELSIQFDNHAFYWKNGEAMQIIL